MIKLESILRERKGCGSGGQSAHGGRTGMVTIHRASWKVSVLFSPWLDAKFISCVVSIISKPVSSQTHGKSTEWNKVQRENLHRRNSQKAHRQDAGRSCNWSGNKPQNPDQRSRDGHDTRHVMLFLKLLDQKLTGCSGKLPKFDGEQTMGASNRHLSLTIDHPYSPFCIFWFRRKANYYSLSAVWRRSCCHVLCIHYAVQPKLSQTDHRDKERGVLCLQCAPRCNEFSLLKALPTRNLRTERAVDPSWRKDIMKDDTNVSRLESALQNSRTLEYLTAPPTYGANNSIWHMRSVARMKHMITDSLGNAVHEGRAENHEVSKNTFPAFKRQHCSHSCSEKQTCSYYDDRGWEKSSSSMDQTFLRGVHTCSW